MSESGNKAGYYYFVSIPNFVRQTCNFIIKKTQPFESKLDIWNQSFQPPQNRLETGVVVGTLQCSLHLTGEVQGGRKPLKFVIPQLLFSSSLNSLLPPHPAPQKSLGSERR